MLQLLSVRLRLWQSGGPHRAAVSVPDTSRLPVVLRCTCATSPQVLAANQPGGLDAPPLPRVPLATCRPNPVGTDRTDHYPVQSYDPGLALGVSRHAPSVSTSATLAPARSLVLPCMPTG